MIKRTIKETIIDSIKHWPVTLLTGAWEVGKSTVCYEIAKELGFNYVSLDEIRYRKEANEDPEMFLIKHEAPLVIDEIQYAPILFEVIESIVNKKKLETGQNNGMYILTGSQTFELMKNVTESMALRVSILKMSPLSIREIKNVKEERISFNKEDIFKKKQRL